MPTFSDAEKGASAQVITLNHELVLLNLRELGSEAEQRRLWLREGPQTSGEMSFFVEVACSLFDDSVLKEKLYSSGTEFGIDVDATLKGIHELIREIDSERPEEEIVADPKMAKVRQLAADAFGRIMSMGTRNKSRIVYRLLEWRDEERRRKLWFPSGDGTEAESSPRDAYWHLFLGEDCWLYLDLGRKEREFSPMFFELSKLASRLAFDRRSLDDVLSDPLMKSGSQVAARIIRELELLGIPTPP